MTISDYYDNREFMKDLKTAAKYIAAISRGDEKTALFEVLDHPEVEGAFGRLTAYAEKMDEEGKRFNQDKEAWE